MVALRLIPCLDVAHGRVVKGVNFVNLRDSGDPVELACRYSDEGADELVFLDIRASVENRNTLLDLVSRTAKSVKIPFTVGGGIDSVSSINDLLRAGADKVSLNSSFLFYLLSCIYVFVQFMIYSSRRVWFGEIQRPESNPMKDFTQKH